MTPKGSGASPWTNQFNIDPQFHPTNPDTDNFNRTAIVDDGTNENVITIEPDYLGLTSAIKYGDYLSPVGELSQSYDSFLRLLKLQSSEAARLLDITLSRDFVGNIIRRQEPGQSPVPIIDYSYIYDGMTRLLSGEGDSETYDEITNLVTKGVSRYTYQDPDEPNCDQMRVASFFDGASTYEYTYDANGSPTAISNRFDFSFDNLNMLRQIAYARTDNYWYNSEGLRVKKTEDESGSWKTTYTIFEGNNPLMQEVYDASGRIQVIFNIVVNGQILSQYKKIYPSTVSTVYFYLDNLNSRRVVVDSAGNPIDRFRYSAWGVAAQDVGSDELQSFTGKDYDASGLIYSNARYYDPTTGRFLTEDPSRKGGNWYAYCENDPINKTDPTGQRTGEFDKPFILPIPKPVEIPSGYYAPVMGSWKPTYAGSTPTTHAGWEQKLDTQRYYDALKKSEYAPPYAARPGTYPTTHTRWEKFVDEVNEQYREWISGFLRMREEARKLPGGEEWFERNYGKRVREYEEQEAQGMTPTSPWGIPDIHGHFPPFY